MSGSSTAPTPPSPSAGGPSKAASIETATSSIERLLSRENGETVDDDDDKVASPAEAEPAEATESEPAETETPEPPEAEEAEEAEDEAEEDDGETDEATAKRLRDDTPIPVTLDGKETVLPLKELRQGYLRTADYTRKTMALSQERAQIAEERAQYGQLLPVLYAQVQALAPPEEPNWEQLSNDDPVEFNRLWAAKQLREQKLQAIASERHRMAQVDAAEQQQRDAQVLTAEREQLSKVNPAWTDAKRRKADLSEARAFGLQIGWSEKELTDLVDHRAAYVLWLASQAHKARNTKLQPQPTPPKRIEQEVRAAPAAVKPGTIGRRPVSEHTRAKQRLARSHSIEDAASVIEGLL